MKIQSIEVIPLKVQFKKSLRFGTITRQRSSNVILRVVTDSGLIGYGEACPVAAFTGETPESIMALIDSRVREFIIGKDPRAILPITRSLERVLQRCLFTLCAVDIALWDLLGKLYDQPIATLLGGAFRNTVEVHGSVGWADDRALMAETALAQLHLGFRSLKLYVGCGDLASDLARLRHVRAAVGEGVDFLLDVNQQWDARTALAALPELRSLGVTLLEQPLPVHDLGGQAEVVRSTPLEIVADESVFSGTDVAMIGAMRTARTVNLGIGKMGGLVRAREAATVSAATALSVLVGSYLELGIATAAALHFAASIQKLPYPSYLIGPLKYEADVTSLSLKLTESGVEVPLGPGLGIEVDEEALRVMDARRAA